MGSNIRQQIINGMGFVRDRTAKARSGLPATRMNIIELSIGMRLDQVGADGIRHIHEQAYVPA
jgi:hypothetical protein